MGNSGGENSAADVNERIKQRARTIENTYLNLKYCAHKGALLAYKGMLACILVFGSPILAVCWFLAIVCFLISLGIGDSLPAALWAAAPYVGGMALSLALTLAAYRAWDYEAPQGHLLNPLPPHKGPFLPAPTLLRASEAPGSQKHLLRPLPQQGPGNADQLLHIPDFGADRHIFSTVSSAETGPPDRQLERIHSTSEQDEAHLRQDERGKTVSRRKSSGL